MHLTHELKPSSPNKLKIPIPISDPDVLEIRKSKGVLILRPDSALGAASGGESGESGSVAAIRMPMLHVSNFKGGTPEMVETSYAILVLVLPNLNSRSWNSHEMEIVEVVADQVAVALSHASVLEESQLMRQKLAEQNRALQLAQKSAMMASQARSSFQKVMSNGMRRPMHSILGLLSIFQEDNLRPEQKIIIDTMLRVSNALSSLINDALPGLVIGDEARSFQVILHLIGYLLNMYDKGTLIFRALLESDSGDKDDKGFGIWRSSVQNDYVYVKFTFQVTGITSESDVLNSAKHYSGRRQYSNEPNEGLSFSMCKTLVQMMQGNIWMSPNSSGLAQGMTLLLKFQLGRPSVGRSTLVLKDAPNPQFRGLKVLLADDDDVNRTVTKKLLEKLGCQVTAVSSGFQCLSAISASGNTIKIILLDLHMPEMDGFEVARRIRKFHSRNWPMIIALTASAEDDVREKCIQVGMHGLIRKPILLQDIADELRTVLQRAGEKL
ncbi:CUGBP Elav-like member 2 [Stylosanthes scabra]|uniref:CUGBP Elav-like member 2 n=1 Tax=Stylosanthes scabra TaxID=79078 RepID=A0ABU6XP58_9FABA|nr:CUGBP Elav-like member 2 [Stylosanthes scabra]